MPINKSKKVELVLFGGMGNQLFQYFAGLYLAHVTQGYLRIDSTFSQWGRSGHTDWISETTLSGNISPDSPKHSLRYMKALLKRRTRDFLARLIKEKELQVKVLRQYHSPAPGYDSRIEKLNPPVTVVGYFQTWKYYQKLKDLGLIPEISMKNPSDWYLEMSKNMRDQGEVLGIHVRRGDYVDNCQIGTLSASYYREGIKELKLRGSTWDAIWIFSDDILVAQRELKELFTENDKVVFIDPPRESHSFESLLLLSNSSSVIIANSTFSWWAATLGNSDKTIICPSKWFARMEDPKDLYPKNWIDVPSFWVNN